MKRARLNIVDDMSLSRLLMPRNDVFREPSPGEWIRMLRTSLRMTQAELAERAQMSQPHLVGIEAGKTDPQLSTVRKIFKALSCEMAVEPRPKKPIQELLRDRARAVALKRLKQSMGTMALEQQAPNPEVFKELLEKRTDEIINDRRQHLWRDKDE